MGVDVLAAVAEALVGAAELFRLRRLAGEGLHHADVLQAVLRLRVDLRDALQAAAVGTREPAAEEGRVQRDERQKAAQHERKARVLQGEDRQRAGELAQIDDEVLRRMVADLRKRFQIAGEARHELARALAVEEALRQALHVRKQVGAHVPLHHRAHAVAARVEEEGAQRADGDQREHREAHEQNPPARIREALREQGACDVLHEQREDEGDGGDGRRAGDVRREQAAIGPIVREELSKARIQEEHFLSCRVDDSNASL